jgi:uncharacterized membrane protein
VVRRIVPPGPARAHRPHRMTRIAPERSGETPSVWDDRRVSPDGHAAHVEPAAADEVTVDDLLGESRWPPIATMVVFMAMNVALRIWLPREGFARLPWLVPVVEAVFLVVLLTSDPTGPHERRRLRRVTLALVGIFVVAALWATGLLVGDLIRGTGVANSASELLASGSVVWLGNTLAFALLYWLMDGGGPPARARMQVPVDFAFTQQINPEMAPPGWRPVFLDYLHLGFTNGLAFSPTDVMPLTHRAKYAMLVQSAVALALFALVVARAVNAFT